MTPLRHALGVPIHRVADLVFGAALCALRLAVAPRASWLWLWRCRASLYRLGPRLQRLSVRLYVLGERFR